jgi:cyclopropane fatty-acyl-phospholipid synthase-like methyltransferase
VSDKPFAPSCERNREPILQVLAPLLRDARSVLEVGSGTGQHAVHFAAAMPWLTWQTSERAEHLPGIAQWLEDAALPNTPPSLALDVATGPWPGTRFDAVFTSNTLHIMGWPQVQAFFAGVDSVLAPGGTVVAYGPFNLGGAYTSQSNAQFDAWLKARDPASAIRDFEAVDALARGIGLQLMDDHAMPANNRLPVWRRG